MALATWRLCERPFLETKLAVGGLAAALAGGTIRVVRQVDCRGADPLVYESAGDAATVRAVQVALGEHRASAAWTIPRCSSKHRMNSSTVVISAGSRPSPGGGGPSVADGALSTITQSSDMEIVIACTC